MKQKQATRPEAAKEEPEQPSRSLHEPSPRKASGILSYSWGAFKLFAILLLLCGVIFPALVYGLGQLLFPDQANGSLLYNQQHQVIGSRLIGQQFTRPEYFHGRPSAVGYNASSSSGSNLGPTNPQLLEGNGTLITLKPGDKVPDNATPVAGKPHTYYVPGTYDGIKAYATQFLKENDLPPNTLLPADIVTASGSGLDPHISVEAALLQVERIVKARHASGSKNATLTADQVRALIAKHTDGRDLGIFGELRVNVLDLNLDLDTNYGLPSGSH